MGNPSNSSSLQEKTHIILLDIALKMNIYKADVRSVYVLLQTKCEGAQKKFAIK